MSSDRREALATKADALEHLRDLADSWGREGALVMAEELRLAAALLAEDEGDRPQAATQEIADLKAALADCERTLVKLDESRRPEGADR